MADTKEFFTGVRSSDLRFDYPHWLAEYIAQAQRLVDTSAGTHEESRRLLAGTLQAVMESLRALGVVGSKFDEEWKKANSTLTSTLQVSGGDLESRLNATIKGIEAAGAKLVYRIGQVLLAPYEQLVERANHLDAAAARLETAAEKAREEREAADLSRDALLIPYERLAKRTERLEEAAARLQTVGESAREEREAAVEARIELATYRDGLTKFEQELLARIAEAKAKLYRGVGLWKRVKYVFRPPTPILNAAATPAPPVGIKKNQSARRPS